MHLFDRLLAVGMTPDDAESIIKWFEARCDIDGLERYVAARENFDLEVSSR